MSKFEERERETDRQTDRDRDTERQRENEVTNKSGSMMTRNKVCTGLTP